MTFTKLAALLAFLLLASCGHLELAYG